MIHRDLKPANIKITPDGNVKVLDFGLAKALAGDQEQLNLTNSPTLSNAATQQGLILGTAAYMSPEQARGKSLDKRTDIWAFGCLLYEMLTGRAAFEGEDVSEILASVIKGDVKLDLLPANIHSRVHDVITRCLQKDVRKRYGSITDALYEIERALDDSKGEAVQEVKAEESRTKLRPRLLWLAAAVIIAALITGFATWNLKSTSQEPRRVIRFDYQLPEGQQLSPDSYLVYNPGSVLTVSPDGRQFAYATPTGLYLRSLEESTSKLISGTEGRTRQPFFSPDGKWIGYYSVGDSKLKKIAVHGGVPVALCAVEQFLGASWSEGDTIVYGQDPGGIMRISGNGGPAETLIGAKSAVLEYPQILPGGKWLAYSSTESGQYEVYVRSFPDVNRTKLQVSAGGGTSPVWSPNERELFYLSNDNYVMVTTVDTVPTFRLGSPKALFKSVYLGASNNNIGHPWDISPDGKRFLMIKPSPSAPTGAAAVQKINIVVNWFEELKQRVPAK